MCFYITTVTSSGHLTGYRCDAASCHNVSKWKRNLISGRINCYSLDLSLDQEYVAVLLQSQNRHV